MRMLARAFLILVAAGLVTGATMAVVGSSGLPAIGPGRDEGRRAAFAEGERPFDFEGEGAVRGPRERGEFGGGLFGLGTVLKNLVIFGVVSGAVAALSFFIAWARSTTQRRQRSQEQLS